MAGESLKIDDEYCKNMGLYYEKIGNELQKSINRYITILEGIKSEAWKNGSGAKALENYIEYAKKIKDDIMTISNSAKKNAYDFISEIETVDTYNAQ